MAEGEAWQREGLTIGALAEEVGAPEHKLRRLINDHLGFRNFAAFVNARRIDAAKARLADPAKARDPVSAIAFDLGLRLARALQSRLQGSDGPNTDRMAA